jgi:hypothetical protein
MSVIGGCHIGSVKHVTISLTLHVIFGSILVYMEGWLELTLYDIMLLLWLPLHSCLVWLVFHSIQSFHICLWRHTSCPCHSQEATQDYFKISYQIF